VGLEYPNLLVAQIYIIFQNDEFFFLLKKKKLLPKIKKRCEGKWSFLEYFGE
jgi:hypothetical protein